MQAEDPEEVPAEHIPTGPGSPHVSCQEVKKKGQASVSLVKKTTVLFDWPSMACVFVTWLSMQLDAVE